MLICGPKILFLFAKNKFVFAWFLYLKCKHIKITKYCLILWMNYINMLFIYDSLLKLTLQKINEGKGLKYLHQVQYKIAWVKSPSAAHPVSITLVYYTDNSVRYNRKKKANHKKITFPSKLSEINVKNE